LIYGMKYLLVLFRSFLTCWFIFWKYAFSQYLMMNFSRLSLLIINESLELIQNYVTYVLFKTLRFNFRLIYTNCSSSDKLLALYIWKLLKTIIGFTGFLIWLFTLKLRTNEPFVWLSFGKILFWNYLFLKTLNTFT
jgi:hypothetical protein